MAYNNILEGIACPECDDEDSGFIIDMRAMFDVYDDGVDTNYDTEWDNDSYIECKACGHYGKVLDFTA